MKLFLISPLVKAFGTVGVPLSTLCFLGTAAVINIAFLYRTASLRVRFFDAFLRPAVCALFTAAVAYFTNRGLSLHIGADLSLLLAVLLSVLVYIALLFLLGAVKKEELAQLPFGKNKRAKGAKL